MYEDIVNPKYLDLESYKSIFEKNKPFPHLVLDDFLSDSFFSNLEVNAKDIDQNNGKKFSSDFETNKWVSKNTELPDKIQSIIYTLNSNIWVNNLSKLANIENIFSTKVGNSKLANYHEMKNNGYLGPHVDHSDDPDTGKPHVLNLLLYLSKEWNENWGGSTLLFDNKGKNILEEVKYKPNRAIIFLHTPYSFHGVKKIKGNEFVRSSIYVDYYADSKNPYRNFNLDFNNKWFKHGTSFVLPKFSDYIKVKNYKYTKTFLKYTLNKMLKG
jgi:Rps23 Pro-64 3,4-dihydroxylase Tpa1-like proline 4-hydroxylase